MELKNLVHKLIVDGQSTVIKEPIGFDNLTMSIKRGEYHGMSAEVSDGNLQFHDDAMRIIGDAYRQDIDSVIIYSVENSAEGIIYSGVLDLSTYQEKSGLYRTIACRIGDAGVKTMFNNRTDVDIDLNTKKTIDGADLANIPRWHKIEIPTRKLAHTNWMSNTKRMVYTTNSEGTQELRLVPGNVDFAESYIPVPFYKLIASEFGEPNNGEMYVTNQSSVIDYLYEQGDSEEFERSFGPNTNMYLDGDITISIKFLENATDSQYQDDVRVKAHLYVGLYNPDDTLVANFIHEEVDAKCKMGDVVTFHQSRKAINMYDTQYKIKAYIYFGGLGWDSHGVNNFNILPVPIEVTVDSGSYFKMTMYDNVDVMPAETDMLMIKDALNVVAGAISENALTVKSDWYGVSEANIGGGALKAITNGYKIRGIYGEDELTRSMQLSFKKAIESLNSIDCIGWGFSEEDGEVFVRVERWNWFYKNDVLMTINNAEIVTRDVDGDAINTKIVIGYKKYADADSYNSIDSVHGERTMVNGIKVVSNDEERLCEFVADTYSIEETIRARQQVSDMESFKYDDTIFVFEIAAIVDYVHFERPVITEYYVPQNINDDATGLISPKEQYNMCISPRRNLQRWLNFLFRTNSTRPYKMSSGTINCDADYSIKKSHMDGLMLHQYLQDPFDGERASEQSDMECVRSILTAETISFDYPISIDEYHAIVNNPYGMINCNGELCWIKSFSYKFINGMASFVLIPMYNINTEQ